MVSLTTSNIKMASTMKKMAKTKAVAEGTFYECGWCGKDGTNTKWTSSSYTSICGRRVLDHTNSFCSEKCRAIQMVENNRVSVLSHIDRIDTCILVYRMAVADAIAAGKKVRPIFLTLAKTDKIIRKVLVLIVSKDKTAARELYLAHREFIGNSAEELLEITDGDAGGIGEQYMHILNTCAKIDTILSETAYI